MAQSHRTRSAQSLTTTFTYSPFRWWILFLLFCCCLFLWLFLATISKSKKNFHSPKVVIMPNEICMFRQFSCANFSPQLFLLILLHKNQRPTSTKRELIKNSEIQLEGSTVWMGPGCWKGLGVVSDANNNNSKLLFTARRALVELIVIMLTCKWEKMVNLTLRGGCTFNFGKVETFSRRKDEDKSKKICKNRQMFTWLVVLVPKTPRHCQQNVAFLNEKQIVIAG